MSSSAVAGSRNDPEPSPRPSPLKRQRENVWPHTGAILVGGKSSRMGRAKHEIVLSDGRTILDHVIDALGKVCAGVVIVGGRSPLGNGTRLSHIADLRPGLGPLGGIEALLASGIDSEYLVCPCDVPRITPEVLRFLIAEETLPDSRDCAATRAAATVLQLENEREPESLPARISAKALPTVRSLLDSGQRAVWALMQRLQAQVVLIAADSKKCFANINAPQDLETYE